MGQHPSELPFRVVQHADEIIGIAEDGMRINLSQKDVAIHAVDRPMLINSICAALGLERDADDAGALGPEILAGTFERLGVRHPVYLLASSDEGDFMAALNRIRLSHASPFIVLTPTARHIGRALQERLNHTRACILALSDVLVAMVDGTLIPIRHPDQLLSAAADAAQGTQPRPNGVYPPKRIAFAGREFACEMTKAQMAFLGIGLCTAEVSVSELMHRKTGVIWKEQYVNEKSCNDKLHQFCTRLNNALEKANTGLTFSFNAATGYVLRRDPIWSADYPLTKD